MAVRANKPSFNIREKLKELTHSIGLKGRELMSAATAQDARDLVSAGRKNLIINGSMAVSQRGTSAVVSSNVVTYAVDRFAFWRGSLSTTLTGTQQTVTDLPEHTKSFRITSAGADTITANTDGWIKYNIEDKDFDQVNWLNNSAKSVTLSFWAKSNRTGQFSVNLNAGSFSTAKYIKTYTLDTADTWRKIEITYPAPSTWALSGNRGAILYWGMATGSTYYTPTPDTGWSYSNNYVGAVGDTQIYGDDGAYFEITGVQLELGKNATDFEYRSYGEELALCQRYYYQIGSSVGASGGSRVLGPAYTPSTNEIAMAVFHPTTMRVKPACTIVNTNANNNLSALRFRYTGNNNFALSSSGTINNTYMTTQGGSVWFQGLSHGVTSSGEIRTNESNGAGEFTFLRFNAEL